MANKRPRISIGLPTRNSARFLGARLDSIFNQTFTDWELVVVDGHSTDGTWERVQEIAAVDPRVRVEQAMPEGIYPAFNRCVDLSSGDLVYIATSDDTMAPDCLAKMEAALAENVDCDIAHCPMKVIGPDGGDGIDWWSGTSMFARSSGEWLSRKHKRSAPYDGLLCLLGDNIYSSVTQLLIRRCLFEKIGGYRSDWGSVGDFHWNLRAGLVASSVHVPDTWASWRMHDDQATAAVRLGSAEHRGKIDGMISDVLCGAAADVPRRLADRAENLRIFLRRFNDSDGGAARKIYAFEEALRGSRPAWEYFLSWLPGRGSWPRHAPASVRGWMAEAIVPLS